MRRSSQHRVSPARLLIEVREDQVEAAPSLATRLALRPAAAARALGISERLLWSKTNAGAIPHVKLGRTTVYPIPLLEQFLVGEAQRNGSWPE